MNSNLQINKTEDGKFELIYQGELIKVYTRKDSAIRKARAMGWLNSEGACAGACVDVRELGAHESAEAPPASNTGGQKSEVVGAEKLTESVSELISHVVMVDGKPKELLLRRGKSTSAHIDTLTLTFSKFALVPKDHLQILQTEEEENQVIVSYAEALVFELFGFQFSKFGTGRNFYKNHADMGIAKDDRIKYGFFAWGNSEAQGDTVCLSLSGVGCTAALDGWENRLYQWIKTNANHATISRIDLAHDFLNGEYTVLDAYQDWVDGGFTSKTTKPQAEMAGAGWLNSPDKGKTLYIGSKKNGSRLVRVYEKGIEQGDPLSPWVRFELQLRNRDIVIDHEILIAPGEYLTGSYPVCARLFRKFNEDASEFERVQKIKQISIETAFITHLYKSVPLLRL